MAITVECDGCGKTLRARDELAGKRVRCPHCKGVVSVGVRASSEAPQSAQPAEPGSRRVLLLVGVLVLLGAACIVGVLLVVVSAKGGEARAGGAGVRAQSPGLPSATAGSPPASYEAVEEDIEGHIGRRVQWLARWIGMQKFTPQGEAEVTMLEYAMADESALGGRFVVNMADIRPESESAIWTEGDTRLVTGTVAGPYEWFDPTAFPPRTTVAPQLADVEVSLPDSDTPAEVVARSTTGTPGEESGDEAAGATPTNGEGATPPRGAAAPRREPSGGAEAPQSGFQPHRAATYTGQRVRWQGVVRRTERPEYVTVVLSEEPGSVRTYEATLKLASGGAGEVRVGDTVTFEGKVSPLVLRGADYGYRPNGTQFIAKQTMTLRVEDATITETQGGRAALGMPRMQVEEALGPPAGRSKRLINGVEQETWLYADGYAVTFEGQVVVSIANAD